jgi:hypothetical protein
MDKTPKYVLPVTFNNQAILFTVKKLIDVFMNFMATVIYINVISQGQTFHGYFRLQLLLKLIFFST